MPPDADIFDWVYLLLAALAVLAAMWIAFQAARKFFRRAWREGAYALAESVWCVGFGASFFFTSAVVRHTWLGIRPGYWLGLVFGSLFVGPFIIGAIRATRQFRIGARAEGIGALSFGTGTLGWGLTWMGQAYMTVDRAGAFGSIAVCSALLGYLLIPTSLFMASFARAFRRAQSQPAS